MTIIKFRVDGLPPKKDGANSMWAKRLESERLVSLRREALQAFKGRPPLKSNIKLRIIVHIGAKNDRSVGDLDTLITGICDGLMKRTARSNLCKDIWDKPENYNIRPDIPIAIDDDSQIISIQAAKLKGDSNRKFYYVTLEGD